MNAWNEGGGGGGGGVTRIGPAQTWEVCIGDLFADLCPGSMTMDFFLMYSGYVQAFPIALSVYDRHTRTDKEFRGFIRACTKSPSCRGLDLCAFLLTPIQRAYPDTSCY